MDAGTLIQHGVFGKALELDCGLKLMMQRTCSEEFGKPDQRRNLSYIRRFIEETNEKAKQFSKKTPRVTYINRKGALAQKLVVLTPTNTSKPR